MKNLCSGEELMTEYIEDRLHEQELTVIEEHISLCDACQQEIIIGSGLVRNIGNIKTDPVSEHVKQPAINLTNNHYFKSKISLLEKCKEYLSDLRVKISDLTGWISLKRWGLQPIKDPNKVIFENIIRLNRNFKDINTEIEIERIGIKDVNILVRILNHQLRVNGIRITLIREQREVSSLLVDAAGYVTFEKMPFAHYGLVVARDGIILGNYYFDITGSHYGKRRD